MKPVLACFSNNAKQYTIESVTKVTHIDTDGLKVMSKFPKDQLTSHERDDDGIDEEEYAEMELLERLETLREDMEDLGVSTLAEVIERIEELHRQLDEKK
jgi:hypothetical protein